MPKSTYKPEYVEQARQFVETGATDREVAELLKVSERTLHRWKHSHPDFAGALEVGKEVADQRVVQSLYRRAVGYSFDAQKVFMPPGAKEPVTVAYTEHMPPDTTAAIFWLKNRQPDQWRDKTEVSHAQGSLVEELEAARQRVAKAKLPPPPAWNPPLLLAPPDDLEE